MPLSEGKGHIPDETREEVRAPAAAAPHSEASGPERIAKVPFGGSAAPLHAPLSEPLEPIHPVPVRALACPVCDVELEVRDVIGHLELVCPEHGAITTPAGLPQRRRAEPRCRVCGEPIEPTGKRGRIPVIHFACHSAGDRRRLEAQRRKRAEAA